MVRSLVLFPTAHALAPRVNTVTLIGRFSLVAHVRRFSALLFFLNLEG